MPKVIYLDSYDTYFDFCFDCMAGISSWMTVASSIREEENAENVSKLIGQLNGYLSTRSFLVPSAAPTLADLDVYLSIVSIFSGDDLESMVGSSVNTRRWLEQVGATLEDLTVEAAKRAEYSKLPPVNIPKGLNPAPRLLPLFFYGDEDESAVAATGSAASAQTVGKNGKISGDKPVGAQKEEITNKQKKEAKQKRANKAAEKAAQTPKTKANKGGAAPAAELNVSALDIRVGKIVKAWEHESSDKLYCEEVDLGEENGPRKIASGLRAFYKLEEMQNRMVLVLCNLKARNLGGFPSHGMVLCASNADHTAVEFAVPPEAAKIGERIVFEGFEGDPEPENKVAKKKIFDKLSPDLKTDNDGIVVWKGVKGVTSAGVCKAVSGMANAQVS